MPVAARRIKIEVAGLTLIGLVFDTEVAMEQWLSARGALVVDGLASGPPAKPLRVRRQNREMLPAAAGPRGPGRAEIDDADALAEIHGLVAQGLDSAAAVRTVAQTMDGDLDTIAHRLRRKLRRKSRTKIGTKL
jgi:hypothetical protein